MSIQIYNSLTKKKEEFVPLSGKTIRIYACGVTVYDRCHIGHARSLYVFDVIRRYLTLRGYDVRFVRNITDIDDKIINKAKELNVPWDQLVRESIAGYERDLESLGISRADIEPRATDPQNIQEMIRCIGGLIEQGFAYTVDGNVYFNVRKFAAYGKLSGQSIEQMQEATRIEKDENKKDPLDFALWKKSLPPDPYWESPWGQGRPGWHIECSCMSLKHLQCETLDIHAGGRDLIFPHHENEIAQAEALSGRPFAKYWIHHGLLTINGQKMAKSLGNFIAIAEALKKYSADELKLLFLFSHYASPVDFTEEKMAEAHKALDRLDILFWKAGDILEHRPATEPVEADFIRTNTAAFFEAMDDDFNTPRALASVFNLVNDTNKFIGEGKDREDYAGIIYAAVDTMEGWLRNIFGLYGDEREVALAAEDQALVDERRQARADKNFKRSDELRDALRRRGIIVEDTKDGQTWRKA